MSLNYDLAIFKKIKSSITANKHSYSSCSAIHRLLISLKYFTDFKVDENNDTNDQHSFVDFMDNVYSPNSYHISMKMSEDLPEIMKIWC